MKEKFFRVISFLLVCLMVVFLTGCEYEIANKIIKGESLTKEEQSSYEQNKKRIHGIIDDEIGKTAESIFQGSDLDDLKKAAYKKYKERVEEKLDEKLKEFSLKIIAGLDFSDEEIEVRKRYRERLKKLIPQKIGELKRQDKLPYRRVSGKLGLFDISREGMEKFRFQSGDRINTEFGKATVIGRFDDNFWFHIDGKEGASFWSDISDFRLLKGGQPNWRKHVSGTVNSKINKEEKPKEAHQPKKKVKKEKPTVVALSKEKEPETDSLTDNKKIVFVPQYYDLREAQWRGNELYLLICPEPEYYGHCNFIYAGTFTEGEQPIIKER